MRAPPPNPLGPLHQRTAGRNKKRNTYRNDSHQGHAWLACGLARRHAKSHVFHKIFDASSTSVLFYCSVVRTHAWTRGSVQRKLGG